ncbi:MAG: hypothetical protein Q4Q22_09445 [Methanosphaera sp.]|nr:hypothetical protein [Methanosphaera sp.]
MFSIRRLNTPRSFHSTISQIIKPQRNITQNIKLLLGKTTNNTTLS